jgi:hypothetical protein
MCWCDPSNKTPVCKNCPEYKKEQLNAINNNLEVKLNKISYRFQNDYFRLLSVTDHLRECLMLYYFFNFFKIYIHIIHLPIFLLI